MRDPADNPVVQRLYKEVFGKPCSEQARKLLHTQFHAVAKLEDSHPLFVASAW